MSQQNENFHIPYMSKHMKHEKNFLLIGYISRFFTWLFLHHKEGTESFPACHFLWQFSHNMKSVMLNFTKLKYANLVENYEIRYSHCLVTRQGPDLFVYTSSSVALFRKIHETPKMWHPSEQNYLFVHFTKRAIFTGGVWKFWKFRRGGG